MASVPTSSFERRWLVATLVCAALSLLASSLAIGESAGAGPAPILEAVGFTLLMLVGFAVAPRLPRMFHTANAQSLLILLGALLPIATSFASTPSGEFTPLHLTLSAGMRNIVVVSAVFARGRLQRRRCALVGLLTTVLAFAFSGSAPVILASLGYVAGLTYWLACNDAERWLPGVVGPSELRLVRATAPLAGAAALCFTLAVLLYPSELGWEESLVSDSGAGANGLTQEDIRRLHIERLADLEEVTERKLGESASQDGDGGPESSQPQADDPAKFSTVRAAPPAAPTVNRQVFRVAGLSAAHLPAMTFDRFDGREWSPEFSRAASFVSGQVDRDGLSVKRFDKTAFELGERMLSSGATAEDFLEQARGAVREWLAGATGEAVEASFREIDDEQLAKLGMLPLRGRIDPDHLLTRYDLEAFSEEVMRNPELRSSLLTAFGEGWEDREPVTRGLLKQWKAARRDTLPPELRALANVWRKGARRGYEEVDAVVRGLRSHAVYDPMATSPVDAEDTVEHFLLESRRGPDYLFASSAVVLLRGIGYPTRLVSGFVARPERYNPFTGQTSVYEDDLHYWAQVRLGRNLWVDVEPTPGFELRSKPPKVPGLVSRSLSASGLDRPVGWIGLGLGGLVVLSTRVFRNRWAAAVAWGRWRLLAAFGGRESMVRSASRLVDHRAAVIRGPRPASRSLGAWLEELVGEDPEVAAAAQAFRRVSERAAFHPAGLEGVDHGMVRGAAERFVSICSVRRLRRATRASVGAAKPTEEAE